MSSKNRKKKRERIQRQRDKKLHEELGGFLDFSRVASFDALYRSSYTCQRGVLWKNEVLSFCQKRIPNIMVLSEELLNGSYKPKKKSTFILRERGKIRLIAPVAFRDRIVQRALVDNVLEPVMKGTLVTGNAASQSGKGPDWSRERFARHLNKAYNVAGNNAYVLQYDFTDYFHSVPIADAISAFENRLHRICLGELNDDASKIVKLLALFLTQYDGLGIGNQTSQLAAIIYPSPLDHAIEEQSQCLGYGRYMDDGYAFYQSKEEAQEGLNILREQAGTLGLTLNRSKTCIRNVLDPICYLKRVFRMDPDTGKLNISVARSSDALYKRHISHVADKVACGELDVSVLEQGFKSKRGIVIRVTNPLQYASNLAYQLAPYCSQVGLSEEDLLELLIAC